MVEFIRRNDDILLGLTQAQVASVLMVGAGAIWIARKARRGELYATAETRLARPSGGCRRRLGSRSR